MNENIEKDLNGLGGWLILVGLGVVVTPIRTLVILFPLYKEIFEDEIWNILTTPGTAAYHPFWSTFISMEIITNVVLMIAYIYLLFLFFMKKKQFPKVYIGVSVFSLFFMFIDAFLGKIVMPNEPMFDPDTVKEFVRSLITVVIWVPYMLRSKRVKVTFTQ